MVMGVIQGKVFGQGLEGRVVDKLELYYCK